MATSESSKPAASYWLDSVFDKTSLQDHQKAMIIACESGDLFALRQLFEKYNVKQGDEPMYDFAPESGAPTTWRMIIAAVAHKHSSIVAFLLSVYPEMDILDSPFVQAVIDNPDFDTLNILCAHPHSPHGGAFYAALMNSRSVELIQKMIDKGALINMLTIGVTIERDRGDVLKLLFSNSKHIHKVDDAIKDPQELLDLAYVKNDVIVALVKDYIKAREKREKKQSKRPQKFKKLESEGGEKNWTTEKTWWQFWKGGCESRVAHCGASEMGSTVDLPKEKHQK